MKKNMIIATRHGLIRFERVVDYWEEKDHALTGLEITSLAIQGEVGLAGTTEGVYVTRDGGENWSLDSDEITTPHICWVSIHPQDPRYLYAGSEPANIFTKQIDDEAWQRVDIVSKLRDENDWFMPYSPNAGCVRGFAFHDNRVYAAVEVGGLLFSDDYGATWSLVPGSTGQPRRDPEPGQLHSDVHSVSTHATSPDYVLAPTGGGFYLSLDGGQNWTKKYDTYCRAVWVDPMVATHMILGPADGVDRGGRIEQTTDGGETWHLIMGNLEEKWPEAMVERFLSANNEIYAVLSNGKILTARTREFSWQYLLPEIGNVTMLALF